MLTVTLDQARQFILLRQGLLGEHRFIGKNGAYQYVRQAGCIQFDPVDVCGRNAELTLQSRVKGITRKTLGDLLYRDRLLVDYSDKELSIWPIEDWPYFADYRERSIEHGKQFPGIPELEERPSPISGSTARSAAIPCRLRGQSSGTPPCTGAGTGTRIPWPPGPCWNSSIRTASC